MLAELAVPIAERWRTDSVPSAPTAERYGLFTIIVLGEVILASVQAIQGAIADPAAGGSAARPAPGGGGPSVQLCLIVGGLLLVFSLWWLYFKRDHVDLIGQGRRVTWAFGYAHVLVFASVAAVGAGLASAVDVVQGAAVASLGPRPSPWPSRSRSTR